MMSDKFWQTDVFTRDASSVDSIMYIMICFWNWFTYKHKFLKIFAVYSQIPTFSVLEAKHII